MINYNTFFWSVFYYNSSSSARSLYLYDKSPLFTFIYDSFLINVHYFWVYKKIISSLSILSSIKSLGSNSSLSSNILYKNFTFLNHDALNFLNYSSSNYLNQKILFFNFHFNLKI